jgi:hypothetical protein
VLSTPLARVELSDCCVPTGLLGHGVNPALMRPGTYAVDGAEYGAQRQSGMFVLSPGDARGLEFVHGRCVDGCWSLRGWRGPNEACAGCGAMVAARTDDCEVPQETRFDPDAVVVERCEDAAPTVPEPFGWQADWCRGPEGAKGCVPGRCVGRWGSGCPAPRHTELQRTRWRGPRLAKELYRDDPPC